jgi:hypothetical protein
LKLFAPGAKEVGKLANIRLPPLADIPGYVPPPLTSVMSITFNPQGTVRDFFIYFFMDTFMGTFSREKLC